MSAVTRRIIRFFLYPAMFFGLFPVAVSADEPAPPPSNWTSVGEWLSWFWNLKVVSIGQAELLVSQIVFALVVLVFGIWLARRISRGVRRRLVSRTSLDVSAVTAVEKLLFYLLAVIVVLLVLQTLQVPIAMFTVFGGAIAIGVGFGAQNIFSNFISGLILMLARPVRLGDTVEVSEN